MILKCNHSSSSSGSKSVWKLVLSETSQVLDQALDLLVNTTLDANNPAVSVILDTIQELRIDTVNTATLNNLTFIQTWFGRRLLPFLPAVSPDFLSCISTKNLTCSSYQAIQQILSQLRPQLTFARQVSVYTHFIKVFLTRNNSTDPACSSGIATSAQWLQVNMGGFAYLATFQDIQTIYSNFSAMEALSQLTVRQLAEVSTTPGQLTTSEQVNMVMKYVPDQSLAAFFDDFSSVLLAPEDALPSVVRSAMLQVVFDRANLSLPSMSDADVEVWLTSRLPPLLVQLSPGQVAPYFGILAGRSCSIEQLGVLNLNMTISTLSTDTQQKIYDQILQTLGGPTPLRCYSDSYNTSFYGFLEQSFMGFQFPNLTAFLSLMPPDRMSLIINSIPPSELGDYLRRPNVVDNNAQLCMLFNSYSQTPQFLETESLPEAVRRYILPCVWPMALSSTQTLEVDAWFDQRLKNYLPFLTKSLISPSVINSTSCLAFQKLVSVLGVYNYTTADFVRGDVYNTIRTYLYVGSTSNPKCYFPSDSQLNSTAWFAQYIGSFVSFLTLDDVVTFGSESVIQVFTVNLQNIALFNTSVLPANLTKYYTTLLYQQDSNFNPLLLPILFRCVAPGPAFTQLSPSNTLIVLQNLTVLCTNLDPQVTAALAGNFGQNIDSTVISALGSQSTGMSLNQISSIKPQDLINSIGTLSTVTGWSEGQAMTIIQSLLSSGIIQINSSSSLISLGTLIIGVPSRVFLSISGNQLISASQTPSLVANLLSGPQIIQQVFVSQIISVNTSSVQVIQNVPNDLATEIPRSLLVGFSSSNDVITILNRKEWKPQQAELFFESVATESASAQLGGPNNLSSSVLQGFTCTGVRNIGNEQVKNLIKACRRSGSRKVKLVESQLTCMYTYIKDDAANFNLYPPDVLLYYDYSLVPQASCRAYFTELGNADFSVFSAALSYKRTALFENAKSCLGITNTSLTKDEISVLGNMCCILDASYILNSDSSILENLKSCPSLTSAQAAAVQARITTGNTRYGAPSVWTEQTLKDLGMLPLYMSSTFYDHFNTKTKNNYLRYFLGVLKENNVDSQKIGELKSAIRMSIPNEESTATDCTLGFINRVTLVNLIFPLNYDINQFTSCLNSTIVKDNLDALVNQVQEQNYTKIVLSKLREAYSASGIIPEDQVQILGAMSRSATMEDINMWTIIQIDTLASLMDASNGPWDPVLAKAIISKYLSVKGNSLGSVELNAIGGPNLCALDVVVIRNISVESIKNADALDISSCTTEKKQELFSLTYEAFIPDKHSITISTSSYQLIQSYLPGADLRFIQDLVSANISMDVPIFTGLLESVIQNLTVSDVKGLLGTNLPLLKSYENVTVVQTWISSQFQSDLNGLGVGLTGGKVSPTTTTTSDTSSTTSGATSSITSGPNSSTTSGATSSITSGPNSSTTSGATSTITSGPNSSTTSGATSSITSGPNSSTTSGATSSITSGPNSSTTSGATSTITSGPNSSTTSGATSSITSGPNSSTTSGATSLTSLGTTSTTGSSSTTPTDICIGLNRTAVQLQLTSAQTSGNLCDLAVEQLACASLSTITAEQLAMILKCNRYSSSSGSKSVWKLVLSETSQVLDQALDLLVNTTLDANNPAVSVILDTIQELRIDTVNTATLNNLTFIQTWFGRRLLPFLPAVSPDFLSYMATRELTCSSYQAIQQILSQLRPQLTFARQMSVYTHFIKVFLTRNNSTDPACSSGIATSAQWLQVNMGGFAYLATFQDIQTIYSNFSAMEALSQLTVRQLAEVSTTPGQLTTSEQVNMVMKYVPDQSLAAFFDDFSSVPLAPEDALPSVVRSAMLQVVFDRANLSLPSMSDADVEVWLTSRLPPLLVQLSPGQVAPYFGILAGRSCSIEQLGVLNLNMTISTLSTDTQQKIYDQILQTLGGPTPLRCYSDSYNTSFYGFLEQSFMSFQFPNLTAFLSLMPPDRMSLIINSIPPLELGDYLRRPNVVDNNAQLCMLFNSYSQTPQFLETESLPEAVRRSILPCVWPMALSSTQTLEVDAWFDQRLKNYLPFLTKSLISPSVINSTSCLAFQKLVSVLGVYNYTTADFVRGDVYNTIRTYLYVGSTSNPKCYFPSNPQLNSTAWFAQYIGSFVSFLTLDDVVAFGSQSVIQIFTVNLQNIALFNTSFLPANLTKYYTTLLYQQDSNFNPLLLPILFRCVAPGPAFTQLSPSDSMIVLKNLTVLCTDLDPQVTAALAGNFGQNIDSTVISALGSQSTGMSLNQISSIKPQDLINSIGTLSTVTGWSEGQAMTIIQSLQSSGIIQINSSSSLISLGTLIIGVPSRVFLSISGNQLISASQTPSLVANLLSGPQIIQQVFVSQIISVNTSSVQVIQNVPNDLATEIPRSLLVGFSSSNDVITILNRKEWKPQQAELFFESVATESASAQLGGPNNLSSSVLQGFTCTGARNIGNGQVKNLIKACRRSGSRKVKLVESQLTCMYTYIKDDAANFNLYPPDVLLYYDYSLVPQASCRAYFTELGNADFSVFSAALSYKRTALFENAKSCLGITNTSLTKDEISVLGNMCCILDASYILNSDSSILENLKSCPSLTSAQAAAVQAQMTNGNTRYGAPSVWTEQTLKDLGMLPLYMSSTFYDHFNTKTKNNYLRYFLGVLKENNVDSQKIGKLKSAIKTSLPDESKRSPACTLGFITRVTIVNLTFPLNYDINQFTSCLNSTIVKDNLDALVNQVQEQNYTKIVLSKLQEAYNASGIIPEDQVQILGAMSRSATMEDINMWSIIQIDTLASLMDASNGPWDPVLAKAIISKYLSVKGNSLGSVELNVFRGPNLCALDVVVIRNISVGSIKNADALDISSCTTEKKQELFSLAYEAFIPITRSSTISTTSYQLIQSYLPGADFRFIQDLVSANISMDVPTFTGLLESVIQNLTVSDVKGLLGTNLPLLKSYENVTVVQTWISSQFQSELNGLGVGLTGGKVSPTTTTPGTSSTTTSGTTSTTTSGTTSTTTSGTTSTTKSTTGSNSTTGNAPPVRDAGFSFFALLVLLITSQYVVM
uniref:Mesothelin-like protein n=1 Tax=Astatotilapia calliptera TaxID=8154 RepID=A0A3P8NTN9_ASTCA